MVVQVSPLGQRRQGGSFPKGGRGEETSHFGVRNKYRTVCARSSATDAKNTVASHKCARNWSGPSVSMEQDVIVEGLLQSIGMRGLVYRRLIADGDSSVHRKLIDAMPYGTTRQVEKVECGNYICRNYVSKVRDLCSNTKLGRNELRSALKDRIMRRRTTVISAIKYRKRQSGDKYYLSIEEIRKCILNSPFHVLGDHSEFSERQYFVIDSQNQEKIT
ncbi:hypothetical protein PR048_006307 [Dryococelus australis]|uniref:Mutator-like transposase domain-containing protein n=1 Tax=Dryococelus australis TaxID=614101 RepID=A0ABQ9IB94_9NEOP|nr:hypothetical protein PR048_006307 [Dryococelus australis]